MLIRIVLGLFISLAAGICYLAGFSRLMSALLVAFGSLVSIFFGLLFVIPEASRDLWFPVHGSGQGWPFFLLAAVLAAVSLLTVTPRREVARKEQLSGKHFQYLLGGLLTNLLSVFLASFFWFPSDESRMARDADVLGLYVFGGTCLYLCGTVVTLYFLYRASMGTTRKYPDFMRRVVLALYSGVHFDKIPALAAFLLVYSPETQMIYPWSAVLALSGYIPISMFLLKLSWQSEKIYRDSA